MTTALVLRGEADGLGANELANVLDQHGLVLDAHHDVLEVHLGETIEDLFGEVSGDGDTCIPGHLQLAEDDGHEVVTKEPRVLVRVESHDILVRGQLLLRHIDTHVHLEYLLLGRRLDFDELGVSARRQRRKRVDLDFVLGLIGTCGERNGWNKSRGSCDYRSRRISHGEAHIARVDEAQTIEDEVQALRVFGEQLLHNSVDRHTNTLLLVVLVSSRNDGAQVEVDRSRVVLLHVLLDVEIGRLLGGLEHRLLDPARELANARECLDELALVALRLGFHVAEVEVARATHQLLGTSELLRDDLEARQLRLPVDLGAKGEAEEVGTHDLELLDHRLVRVEPVNLWLRQTVGALIVEVHLSSVVEGAGMVEHRTFEHLEVHLGCLEHKLVGVTGVELLHQRRGRERRRLAVNLAEHVVEEGADGLGAHPEVLVGVERAVRRESPGTLVAKGVNHRPTEVLSRADSALDLGSGVLLVGLGEAEADHAVVGLRENGAHGVLHCSSKLSGLVGENGEIGWRYDHVGLLVLHHTALFRLEQLLHVGKGESSGADVSDKVGHGLRVT